MGGLVAKTQSGINTAALITGVEASAAPAAGHDPFPPAISFKRGSRAIFGGAPGLRGVADCSWGGRVAEVICMPR